MAGQAHAAWGDKQRTATFLGVDAEGELLNDLHYFDMTSE